MNIQVTPRRHNLEFWKSLKPRRPMVFINVKLIKFTNTKTDQKLIDEIAEDLDIKKFGVLPVFKTPKAILPTDGNHRIKGAIKAGYTYFPAVFLTREEFDYVKYSKRTVDIDCYIPKEIQQIDSL